MRTFAAAVEVDPNRASISDLEAALGGAGTDWQFTPVGDRAVVVARRSDDLQQGKEQLYQEVASQEGLSVTTHLEELASGDMGLGLPEGAGATDIRGLMASEESKELLSVLFGEYEHLGGNADTTAAEETSDNTASTKKSPTDTTAAEETSDNTAPTKKEPTEKESAATKPPSDEVSNGQQSLPPIAGFLGAAEAGVLSELIQSGSNVSRFKDPLWGLVPEGEQKDFANRYVGELFDDRRKLLQRLEWRIASDRDYFELAIEMQKQETLLQPWLAQRTSEAAKLAADVECLKSTWETDLLERKSRLALEENERNARLGLETNERNARLVLGRDEGAELIKIMEEVRKHLKKWRGIATWGVGVTIVAFGLCIPAVVWAFMLVSDKKMDGYELATTLFTLAVLAVSAPSVLLLQRPLKGIDAWSPSGPTKDEAADKETQPAETKPAKDEAKAP